MFPFVNDIRNTVFETQVVQVTHFWLKVQTFVKALNAVPKTQNIMQYIQLENTQFLKFHLALVTSRSIKAPLYFSLILLRARLVVSTVRRYEVAVLPEKAYQSNSQKCSVVCAI